MSKIIITGSRGLIGKEVVKYFRYKKHKVIEIDKVLGHDLEDENFIDNFFWNHKADYLINLAGKNDHVSIYKENQNLFGVETESFREYMEQNVTILFNVCRMFLHNNPHGAIVNFGSLYSMRSPRPELSRNKHPGYTASKHAVIGLTRHLAAYCPEYCPDARINCVCCGGVEADQSDEFKEKYSDYVPAGRMMHQSDLFGLLEYLCSEESKYMTGSVITIDGGYTAV
jgi:NAD(P)-dependent dehydrogenase (short-subunit alcohol dehydrogenase family)